VVLRMIQQHPRGGCCHEGVVGLWVVQIRIFAVGHVPLAQNQVDARLCQRG
jgi:hypothetical protein